MWVAFRALLALRQSPSARIAPGDRKSYEHSVLSTGVTPTERSA